MFTVVLPSWSSAEALMPLPLMRPPAQKVGEEEDAATSLLAAGRRNPSVNETPERDRRIETSNTHRSLMLFD